MLRCLSLIFLFAPTVTAQGPVTIQLAQPKQGQSYSVTTSTQTKTEFSAIVNGTPEKKTETRSQYLSYRETILEGGTDGAPHAKTHRVYSDAEIVVDGQKSQPAITRKNILVEWKKDKYSFSVDGKPTEDELTKVLELDFIAPSKEKSKGFLPAKPVNVGESWKFDTAQFVKDNGKELPFDLKKDGHSATGTLTKTEVIDGALWGTMVYKVKLNLSAMKGDTAIPLREGSTLNVTLTIRACIDGSRIEGERKTETKAILEVNHTANQLKVNLTGSSTRTVYAVK